MTVSWITDRRKAILTALYKNENGLNQRNIAEKTKSTDSTVAKAIDRIEELGLVERDENRVYSLTEDSVTVTQHVIGISAVLNEQTGEQDG